MALILRNGGSQSPDRWLKEPRNNHAKKYVSGTKFEDIIKLYQFDQELSALVFPMISKIEVALRVRLVEALLIHGEPLVLQDSSIFREKKRYWSYVKI